MENDLVSYVGRQGLGGEGETVLTNLNIMNSSCGEKRECEKSERQHVLYSGGVLAIKKKVNQ
jgi:hypothetical protein